MSPTGSANADQADAQLASAVDIRLAAGQPRWISRERCESARHAEEACAICG